MTAGTGQLFVFVLFFSSLSVCVQVQDAVYCLIKNKVLTTETKVKGSSSPGICRVFYFKIKALIWINASNFKKKKKTDYKLFFN